MMTFDKVITALNYKEGPDIETIQDFLLKLGINLFMSIYDIFRYFGMILHYLLMMKIK